MDYLTLSRKWRPGQFDELVGQEHVVQTLRNAIAFDRVAHAYLFSGPRGTGKTSVARIFSKALRCPNVKDAIPCGECSECVSIAQSRSVDVSEIDGASNNGVEAVRAIRENVSYGASSGKYKIFIIDEVHMLSISAFNALLKTLEEPPPNVIFIFATTEVHKIPLTILSRCQRFEFRRLSNVQIVERLKQILETESISIEEDGLRLIANHSDGALRDAQSLLDQVISSFSGSSQEAALTEADIVKALGVSDTAAVRKLIHHIVSDEVRDALAVIANVIQTGVDLKHFSERLLEELRRAYMVAVASEYGGEVSAEDLDISNAQLDELKKICSQSSVSEIERMSQLVNTAISQLALVALPRYTIEMLVVRMAKLKGLDEVEQSIKEIAASLKEGKPIAVAAAQPVHQEAVSTQPTPSAPPANPTPRSPAPMQRPEPPPIADEPAPMMRPSATSMPKPEPGTSSWKQIVESLMKKRPLIGALLSHANFKLAENNGKKSIELAFPEGSFYEKQVKEKHNYEDIMQLLKEQFGESAHIEITNSVEETSKSLETQRNEEITAIKKQAVEHPAVLQAQEQLGAEIVDVKVDK